MGNPASLRLFGVERPIYANPQLLADLLLQQGSAPAETEAEDITALALGFRFALGLAVPTAREELAEIIRGTESAQWEQVVAEVEAHYRQFAPHRFGSAGSVIEQVERALTQDRLGSRNPAPDRDIVETKTYGEDAENREAFSRIILKAALGDAQAGQDFLANARGSSRWAAPAQMLLAKWDRLQKWVHLQERTLLAKEAAKFFDEEQAAILKELMEGRLTLDNKLGEQMVALGYGTWAFIKAIDKFKGKQNNPQWETAKARKQFHALLNQADILSTSGTLLIDHHKKRVPFKTRHMISVIGFLGQTSGMKAAALLAVSKVVIGAAAKGIRIEVDFPPYLAIAKEGREKLVASLTELLQNAIKYSDPEKSQKTIRVVWDRKQANLIVADNGIGIKEPQKIWDEGYQERPDATADRGGLGLAIVKKDLAEIGWGISVESTPAVGSTFTLTPPPTTEPFDLKPLTPEMVESMPPEERIRLGKQLFLELRQTALTAIDRVVGIAENDVEELKSLGEWLRERIRKIDQIFLLRHLTDPTAYSLLVALKSSSLQYPLSIEAAIFYALEELRSGKWNWAQMKQWILDQKIPKQFQLVDQHGFQHDKSQGEISFDLVYHYLRIHSPLKESWEENQWVLRFPKTCEAPLRQRPSGLRHSPWPPDPQNDIALKTYLELLGWEMTVHETADTLEVRVDFSQ